jgi:hypothetical protein
MGLQTLDVDAEQRERLRRLVYPDDGDDALERHERQAVALRSG